MNILITGASGQLGNDLVRVLGEEHVLAALTRHDLDVTDRQEVMAATAQLQPDVIIHAAAFTHVDEAEHNREAAFAVNSIGTGYIAEAARRHGAKLVYISTDYVFDGRKGSAYLEKDPPSPINVYGWSKLQGEQLVRQTLDEYFIVRTAWLFGAGGRNFVKTMHTLATSKPFIYAAEDAIGSPTYSLELARFIRRLLVSESYGTYHGVCQGYCSRYEFAREIVRIAGLDPQVVVPVPSAVFKLPAPRPANSALESVLIVQRQLPELPDWRTALRSYMKEDAFFHSRQRKEVNEKGT
jgi:dTDP-4-dehydrorhamnose reductase